MGAALFVYSCSHRGQNGTDHSPAGEAGRASKRTLTNLYNARPPWLALAHRNLDAAVFAAYDCPRELSDEQILERLLSLNRERSRASQA